VPSLHEAELIVKLAVAIILSLGVLFTWMPLELVELGNLNSEIWYAVSRTAANWEAACYIAVQLCNIQLDLCHL